MLETQQHRSGVPGILVIGDVTSGPMLAHEAEGFVKVLADERSDQILGVHIIGPSAGELIGEYCVALEFSASAEDIALICHPHPTRSEALRQAAMSVHDRAMQA